MAAGYSQTPLAKKLGIKPGFVIELVDAPAYYFDLFEDMPADIIVAEKSDKRARNCIHYFTKDAAAYEHDLPLLRKRMASDGMIWVSWPKRASGIETNISENLIRDVALRHQLVDIKVCAVDETWSGLKLVIPLHLRK